MTEKLNETIATVEYDNLFYSNDVSPIAKGVIIAAGQGELKRGTVLAKFEDAEELVILGTTKDGENDETILAKADCVLCDDVDATEEDTAAVAYFSGDFNLDAIIVMENYTVTQADKDALRTKGILLGKMLG